MGSPCAEDCTVYLKKNKKDNNGVFQNFLKKKMKRRAGGTRRKTSRIGRVIGKLKSFSAKHKLKSKVRKYGPALLGAGITTAGLVGAALGGGPAAAMAGHVGGGLATELATKALMSNRNTHSHAVTAHPTGSRSW